MLQDEKDPLERELYSPKTEVTHADVTPVDQAATDPGLGSTASHEATLASSTVQNVRVLTAKQVATMEPGRVADILPSGKADELLLSAGLLARIAHKAAWCDANGPYSPSSETVAGIVAVAHGNLPAHCVAEPETLRQIKLAAHLHHACQDALDGTEVAQLTAESLLRSYEYSETELVMRAVLALNRMRHGEARNIRDGVKSGGVAFAAVVAAKTHYNLTIGPDIIRGDEEKEELSRKRAQREGKLEVMRELLREPEGLESSAARWLMHRIFSSSPVELNRYLHRSGPRPIS